MIKLWKVFGILLASIAIICFGICIFQDGQNKLLLPIGLLCNSLAFFLYCFMPSNKK